MFKVMSQVIFFSLFLASFAQATDTTKMHTPPPSETLCYNVIDYGAKGDGITKNTQSIQSAIDACSKTGGTVVFPHGIYLSGTLFMKSNVTLHLMSGAVLLGSQNLADYQITIPMHRSYTDNYVNRSLIYGENLKNIGIIGQGTIDGNGHGPEFQEPGYKNKTRPYVIRFITCKKIRINDITLLNSLMWMQHYLACENLMVRGIEVWDHGNRNNDAIDIDGCRNVVISDCIFDSDDDGITLKSTSPSISENITINNCIISSHCNAIKMGTETTGGFRNITISNCVIKPSENKNVIYGTEDGLAGIALEIVDGGILEFVTISNISMERVSTPIFVKLGNRARQYKEGIKIPDVGIMRNINISNIIARGTTLIPSSFTGIPGYFVENVSLSNIQIISKGGGVPEDARREVPENSKDYPESKMFGPSLPSYGLYVRHVKNIAIHNVNFMFEQPDARPALIFDDVSGLNIGSLKAEPPIKKEPLIKLIQTKDVQVHDCKAPAGTNTFLKVEGNESGLISLFDNDLRQASIDVEIGKEVKTNAVKKW